MEKILVDKTNYSLLSIVGIVAIAAIFAMFVHARATDTLPGALPIVIGSSVAQNAVSDSTTGITGNVVASASDSSHTLTARSGYSDAVFDYNSDGALNQADADILKAVVARSRFCPPEKKCDVNEDGLVDSRDIGAYQAGLVRRSVEAAQSATVQSAPAPIRNDVAIPSGALGIPTN